MELSNTMTHYEAIVTTSLCCLVLGRFRIKQVVVGEGLSKSSQRPHCERVRILRTPWRMEKQSSCP